MTPQQKAILMPDLPINLDVRVKDVINEKDLAEYMQGILFLSIYITNLNTDIYLVEQILNFPLVFFYDKGETKSFFFEHFVENALDICILTITRLVTDQKGDLFTLPRFQRRILKMVKSDYQTSFRELLKENELLLKLMRSLIQEKAEDLRDNRLAHFTLEYFREFFDSNAHVTLESLVSDIKAVSEMLSICLDNLTLFGASKFSPLPFEYRSDISIGRISDIELVLDSIARASYILNLPESDPHQWFEIMSTKREQLNQFNHYRKKFGLPEVALD